MERNTILEYIDDIDESQRSSEVSVIEAMIESFDKSFLIMENYSGDDNAFEIFQESKKEGILDKVKKESKNDDNKFITILKFIPRLVIAIVKAIKQKLKDSKLGDKLKKLGDKLNKGSDIAEKRMRVKELNKIFAEQGEECYLDEKSGKIKFKRSVGGILSRVALVSGLVVSTYNLFSRIKAKFDVNNPTEIKSFISDCDKIIHGDHTVSKLDIFSGGIHALGEIVDDITSVTGEIALLGEGIKLLTDDVIKKDLIKDMPNEKKQEVMKSINDLSGRIAKISGMITGAVKALDVITDWSGIIDDISNHLKTEDELMRECLRENVVESDDTLKSEVNKLRSENPKANGESDTAYEERINTLRIKLIDGWWNKHPEKQQEIREKAMDTYKDWLKKKKVDSKKKKSDS